MKQLSAGCMLVLLFVTGCFAQSIPAFKSLRYDEDYQFLKKDSSINWYRKTKYHALSQSGDTYISFGGEIRYQYFRFKNEEWGAAPEDKDGYLLTRYLGHADFHTGKYFRAFVQLQSSLANGMVKTPSPADENQLDVHQAFLDVRLPLKQEQQLIVRLGRQELSYGSQRLVSVRDGPNNRQSFDAAKLLFMAKRIKADVFFSHYVKSSRLVFDDEYMKGTKFWGTYLVFNQARVLQNVDLYYFGLWKPSALFDNGKGEELRHSIGARLWNTVNGFRYDVEGVYQFGSLEEKEIDAWTLSLNGGYKFSNIRLKPEIGLKTELISGNRNYGGNKLQTFNPLFPRGGYFGLAALIGPSNLFDIHPSLSLDLSKKLFLNFDSDLFWRYSKHDGLYGPSTALIYSGKTSSQLYAGSQYSTDLVYTPNNYLYFRGEFTWFKAGDFFKEAGPGKDIFFTCTTMQLKF